jgi:hypothetical protein
LITTRLDDHLLSHQCRRINLREIASTNDIDGAARREHLHDTYWNDGSFGVTLRRPPMQYAIGTTGRCGDES